MCTHLTSAVGGSSNAGVGMWYWTLRSMDRLRGGDSFSPRVTKRTKLAFRSCMTAGTLFSRVRLPAA